MNGRGRGEGGASQSRENPYQNNQTKNEKVTKKKYTYLRKILLHLLKLLLQASCFASVPCEKLLKNEKMLQMVLLNKHCVDMGFCSFVFSKVLTSHSPQALRRFSPLVLTIILLSSLMFIILVSSYATITTSIWLVKQEYFVKLYIKQFKGTENYCLEST